MMNTQPLNSPFLISVPDFYSFKDHDIYDFDAALQVFDWGLGSKPIRIDLTGVHHANYQALSLFALYIWHLKLRACRVDVRFSPDSDVKEMWRRMGLFGWSQVLFGETNFRHHKYKPLIAIRSQDGFRRALDVAETFAKRFNVEYQKTLRYVISELLYNTLEHGHLHSGSHDRVGNVIGRYKTLKWWGQ